MASHKFMCPQCHEEVTVPREAIGQRAKCCMCGEMVLVPSPEKDKAFRKRISEEQRTELDAKLRQDEEKRLREEEERRNAAELARIRMEDQRKLEEKSIEERHKREAESQAEQRNMLAERQEAAERIAQEIFNAPVIINPEDAVKFVDIMAVILILAGGVAGVWGCVEAANKQSAIPFIVGAIVLLQCFLVAAFFFLATSVAQNMFYICKNLEHYTRRWQEAWTKE